MRIRLHPLVVLASLGAFVLMLPAGKVVAILIFFNVPSSASWTGAAAISACTVVIANLLLPPLYRFCTGSSRVTMFFSHYDAEKRVSVSHVEAMIASGRYDDAAEELDLLLRMHGLDRNVCLLAIDLHLGKFGNADRAELLLRRMRSEQPHVWEGFATQRLVDLYMRAAETHPRAMTELRRLVARFPATPEARGAQQCLDNIRQDQDRAAV